MRNNEKGQAILLVVVALSIFLLGAVGLAIDGSQVYAHRQMAQAAADAAAQAGIFTIFVGTYTVPAGGADHTCTASDAVATASSVFGAPCYYALKNGFLTSDDTVVVSFPASPFNGVTGSSNYAYPFEQVTITRTFHTSFMRFLGSATSTVKAIAAAGIVQSSSPIPILVLHPTLPGALSLSNNTQITICGGPGRSINVNSIAATALSINSAIIDLSHAGPLDDINNPCVAGTGADFGIYGGPTAANQPSSSVLKLGVGTYIQPAAPFNDPLAGLAAPTQPANAPAKTALANGVGGCPASPLKACNTYYPGYYPSGLNITNETAVFEPGLYYVDGGDFGNGANGEMYMCQSVGGFSCTNPGLTGNLGTGSGMMVYLHNDGTHDSNFNVGSNSNATLVGSDNNSTYRGVLFFGDRNAMNHRGQGSNKFHSIGAGATVNLTGTLYSVNTKALTTNTYYQDLNFGGNASGNTTVRGEVIVSALSMSGGGTLTMQLNPNYLLPVDQVALIK